MARFVSFRGKFYPALEEVSLVYEGTKSIPKEKLSKFVTISGNVLEKGMPYIYKGPDRAAMKLLKAEGVEFLGGDFQHDAEFLQMVRTMNFNTVEDYLKHVGYDREKDEKRFKEKAIEVSRHELPESEEEILIMGGGQDKANSSNDIVGGFGEPRVRPKDEIRTGQKKKEGGNESTSRSD